MSTDVNVNIPDPIHTDSNIHGGLNMGLDNIGIKLQPTDSNVTLGSKKDSPLVANVSLDTKSEVNLGSKSDVSVDMKPVSVDLCLSLRPHVPRARFHAPYSTRLSFHVFGFELFGLSLKGEMNLHTSEVKQERQIVFGQAPANSGGKGRH